MNNLISLPGAAVLLALMVSVTSAKAEITVTRAEYAAGVLVVRGETSRPHQRITLDKRFHTRTDRNNRFQFRIRYLPNDCVVSLRAGKEIRPAYIANCSTERSRKLRGAGSR